MDPAVARGDADVEADEAGAPVRVAAAVAEGVGAVAVAVAAAAEEGGGVVVVTTISWEAGRRAAAATAGAVGGVGEGCKGCGGGGVSRGSIVGPDWGSPGTTYQGRGRPPVGWSDVVDPFCTITSEAEMFELYACYKSVVSTEKREERDGCCPRSGRRRKYTLPPCCVSLVETRLLGAPAWPPGRETKRRFSGSRDPAATAARRETAELRPEGGPTDPTSLVQRKTTDYYAVSR